MAALVSCSAVQEQELEPETPPVPEAALAEGTPPDVAVRDVALPGGGARQPPSTSSRPGPQSGAGAQPLPEWVRTGRHPDYPEAQFLTAVGYADELESRSEAHAQADQRARSELVLSLQTKIQSEVTTGSRFEGRVRGEETSSDLRQSVDELTRTLSGAVLDGARIVDRAVDSSRGYRLHFSLVALDRRVAGENLRQRILEAEREADGFLRQSEDAGISGKLSLLVAAYESLERAQAGRQTLGVLSGAGEAPPARVSSGSVLGQVQSLLSRMRLDVVEGQGQEGQVGQDLPRPIEVRLVLADESERRGVNGAALEVRLESPDLAQASSLRLATAGDGSARFSILPLRAGRKEVHYVSVRVAIPLSDGRSLSGPSADVEYYLRRGEAENPKQHMARHLSDRLKGRVTCLAIGEATPEAATQGQRSEYGRYIVRRIGNELANFGRFRVYELTAADLASPESLTEAYRSQQVDAVLGGSYLDLGGEVDLLLTVTKPFSREVLGSESARVQVDAAERLRLLKAPPEVIANPNVAAEVEARPELEKPSDFYLIAGNDPRATVEVDTRKSEYFCWRLEAPDSRGKAYGGEKLDLTVRSTRSGFLTIVAIDQGGDVTLLCPSSLEPTAYIYARRPVSLPTEAEPKRWFGYAPPAGWMRFKVFVSDAQLVEADQRLQGAELLRRIEAALQGGTFAEGRSEVQVREKT